MYRTVQGARPYQRIGIIESTGRFAATLSIRPRNGFHQGLTCPNNDCVGRQRRKLSDGRIRFIIKDSSTRSSAR
jgi:hypothetical protein